MRQKTALSLLTQGGRPTVLVRLAFLLRRETGLEVVDLMLVGAHGKQKVKVLIAVRTCPIPSAKYEELFCTAGVAETGDFIRLCPINFRALPFIRPYKKYEWIEVVAEKYRGRDVRKESCRPDGETIQVLGESVQRNAGNWAERVRYALARKGRSMEELNDRREAGRTSLGVFKPQRVPNLAPGDPEWKAGLTAAVQQAGLWEDRTVSEEPPRKVPFKFPCQFACDDARCKGHRRMSEEWEVGGALLAARGSRAFAQRCGEQGPREVSGRALRAGQGHALFGGDHLGPPGDRGGDEGFLPETPSREEVEGRRRPEPIR